MPNNNINVNGGLHFGPDTLRLNISSKYDGDFLPSLFRGYSLNSNQNNNVVFFGFRFTGMWLGHANKEILILSYKGDSIFYIEKILDNGIIKTISYTITFYSAFFYVPELYKIFYQISNKFNTHISISRLDICLDVPVSVNDLNRDHNTRFQKYYEHGNGGTIETFYLGPKKNNPKHFIRVYDKKLDSGVKGKFHLYADYLAMDVVSRIEVQLNVLSCKQFGLNYKNVLTKEKLRSVFKATCFNKDGTDFFTVKFPNYHSAKKLIKVKNSELDIDQLRYIKVFVGYGKQLHKYGVDVLSIINKHVLELE